MADYRLLPAGDTALSVEFGQVVDREISGLVLALARRVAEAKIAGIVECVPTFRSLMVYYDPLLLPYRMLSAHIAKLTQGLRATQNAGRSWRLPVCYDASVAPDLADVATRTNLTPAQVIERHSAPAYHVYMLGFLPGQPYLGDVSDRACAAAAAIAADENPGRIGRDRNDHDLHFPARKRRAAGI